MNPTTLSYARRATAIPIALARLAQGDATIKHHLAAFLAGHVDLEGALILMVAALAQEKAHLFDAVLRNEMLRVPAPVIACQLCGEKFKETR
jgi:hypothetical protein